MKNKIFTFVLLILFFIGLSLLLYPTVSDYWNSFHQSRAIAGYAAAVEELDEEAYEKCLADARAYNAELVGDGGRFQPTAEETARYNSLLDIAGNGIMGYIEIPSIGVDLPVRHGADAYALENGAGHLHGTSLPVGGQSTHSVITGHTGVADKALFTRLTELRKGDVFYVRVAAQTLAYKVERIRKVDPDDLRDVRIQPGRDLVTLVTCTPIFLTTYRLLVTGERVSMPDDAPYPEDAPRTTGRDARPLLVSGVALLAGMPVAMVESRPRVRPYGRHGMKR